MSNSLSSRSALSIERSFVASGFRVGAPRKSLVAGGPHWARPEAVNGAQPGSSVLSNMSPSAEVLDEESVRIAPVVEDLAALDVSADAPGPEIAALAEVFAAGGQRVEIADLIRGVHVAVRPGPAPSPACGGRRAWSRGRSG